MTNRQIITFPEIRAVLPTLDLIPVIEAGFAAYSAGQTVVPPAISPLLHVADLQPGTHIMAVGSDTPQKQELDSAILGRADLVVADSIAQCVERGEISHAIKDRQIQAADLLELGHIIASSSVGRSNEEQISLADLTGVAVQDIQIANAVTAALA